MRLGDILPAEISAPGAAAEVAVTAVTASSGHVKPGALFAALPGAKTDGTLFVSDAIQRGARVILAQKGKVAHVPPGITLIEADNPHRVLALIAARFAGSQPECAVAVTGTSGKTSVAEFTRQIFSALGRKAASLGTIGVVKPDGAVYGSLTTPDPVTLAETLAGLAGEGITHLAFEASSHGLDQHRLDGVKLTAAAFTNLGRDHMDYHPTIEAYLAAKLRLFMELLEPGQPAVINMSGAYSDRVRDAAAHRGLKVLTVSRGGETLGLEAVTRDGFGQILTIRAGGERRIRLPLVGGYQVENALTAAGLAIAAGEQTSAVLSSLETLKGVPGRLDIIGEKNGGLAIVDYAHKPEALDAALDACRPFASGKLICVFGCGGDRDKGKRPVMGRIAAEKSDVVIVTDDNPRSETPADIRAQILAEANGAREIGDRGDAIRAAVAMMGMGDVVLVAGKGHETGQIVGTTVLPFSDADEIRRAISMG